MIRTIAAVAALVVAVLLLPLWVQVVLFLVAVWTVPYRLALLLPAIFSDALYAPTRHLSITTVKLTMVVVVLIVIRWLLLTYTRFGSWYHREQRYGMEA